MDEKTWYDLPAAENDDPFRDPPVLRKYMEKWDGQAFPDLMELDMSKGVLETGIGTGRLADKAACLCRHLTGIDISPMTVERAREDLRRYPNITLICGDLAIYPFEETFDVICSSLTMMHFRNKETVIDKMSSLLKSGGLLCLSPDKSRSEWIDTGTRRIRVYPDTPGEICLLADKAGPETKRTAKSENAWLVAFVKRQDRAGWAFREGEGQRHGDRDA